MTDNLPQRDRRQRRRIITLRNVGIAVLALVVAFGAFSLWRELNPASDDGSALLDARKQEIEELVVSEANPYVAPQGIDEHDPREPFWTDRPNQEDILGVDPYEPYRRGAEAEPAMTKVEPEPVEPRPLEPARVDPEPVLSGAEEPFLEQRSEGRDSRIKITGAGTDVKLERPAPDER